jgi:hypothetical protein
MGALTDIPPQFRRWTPAPDDHPLAALDGASVEGATLRVLLGRRSRFGAQYFAVLLESPAGILSREAVLSGLHNQGPLPSYNWIEVAETNQRLTLLDGSTFDMGEGQPERLLGLIAALIPPGGHLMVEYDSAQRASTARALAKNVPPIATPLGELLFRLGLGPKFKDWQIAEGGSEGPRKLQAYRPPSPAEAERWRIEAVRELEAFLEHPPAQSEAVEGSLSRARAVLARLRGDQTV